MACNCRSESSPDSFICRSLRIFEIWLQRTIKVLIVLHIFCWWLSNFLRAICFTFNRKKSFRCQKWKLDVVVKYSWRMFNLSIPWCIFCIRNRTQSTISAQLKKKSWTFFNWNRFKKIEKLNLILRSLNHDEKNKAFAWSAARFRSLSTCDKIR